jgi:hypothetical protein
MMTNVRDMICSVKLVWVVLLPVKVGGLMVTVVPSVELVSLRKLIWVISLIPSLEAEGREDQAALDSLEEEVLVVEDELVPWQVMI